MAFDIKLICFLLLVFEHAEAPDDERLIELGIYSTRKKAEAAIDLFKDKTGFNRFPVTNFRIMKFGLQLKKNGVEKSGREIYEVFFDYIDEGNYINTNIYDYYDLYEDAEAAVQEIKKSKLGKKYELDIEIFTCIVDYTSPFWQEGFDA